MDYPYFIFYLLLVLLSFLYWRTRQRKYVNCAFIITFVFFAFRAPVVGADTWNYVRYLTGERNYYNEDPRPLEPLFIVYREILCYLTNSRFVVMVVNTVISTFPLYLLIKRYSLNPPLSILFFCFLGGFSVYFVGLRQIIALTFLYVALLYWLMNNQSYFKKVLLLSLCVVIAFFFHTSSVFYSLLIIGALIPIKVSRIACCLLIIGSALVGIVLHKFEVLDFFSLLLQFEFSTMERLNNYLENDELNDGGQLNILLRMSVVAIISIFYSGKEKLSHPFMKLFLFEVLIYNLLHSVPMAHRLCYPLSIFGAVVFTWSMEKPKQGIVAHKFVNIIVVLVVLYYLRSQAILLSSWDVNDEERMHPYFFIFEDYSKHPSITKF